MFRHCNYQSCNVSIFRWYPSVFSTHPASVIIRLGLWPQWQPQLLFHSLKTFQVLPASYRNWLVIFEIWNWIRSDQVLLWFMLVCCLLSKKKMPFLSLSNLLFRNTSSFYALRPNQMVMRFKVIKNEDFLPFLSVMRSKYIRKIWFSASGFLGKITDPKVFMLTKM